MRKLLFCTAGLIGLAMGGAAQAATLVYAGGTGGLTAGQTDYANFDTTNGNITGTSGGGGVTSGNSSGVFAEPAYGDQGDNYYYVFGGGTVDFSFTGGAASFGFDLGSADDYNTLRVFFFGGGFQDFVGAALNPPGPATGNQSIPGTNGRVTISGDGQTIVGARFISGQPSFEFDNIGVTAVPEPTTWALLILGFGAIGSTMRRRNATARSARAKLHFA